MICGVDEAGRGPLAGPVCAAAVILDPNNTIDGLQDSKTLSNKKLIKLHQTIFRDAIEVRYAFATVEEIDAMNILQASLLAMKRAILMLNHRPSQVIIDGDHTPRLDGMNLKSIIKGDSLFKEISAASIIAKVQRDKAMILEDEKFPHYNFKQHKGYPTKEHIALIKKHGISQIHRKTFKPVKSLI